MGLTYARIRNHQRKQALKPVTLQPVNWQPQVRVTFTRDVCGWLDREQGLKFQFGAGKTYLIDEQHAVEFLTKGYCTGELPRAVSDDEAAEIRSSMVTIGMGHAPQTRNGGDPHQ
jgi:hypothetical protein